MKLDVEFFKLCADLVGRKLNLLEIVLVLRQVQVDRSINGFLHLGNQELDLVIDRLLLCFKNRQPLLELGKLFLRLVTGLGLGSWFLSEAGLPP